MVTAVDLKHFFLKHVEQNSDSLPTIEFYSHKNGKYKMFSNFFEHDPFDFVPPKSCRIQLEALGRSTNYSCTYAEKAIMLCKAALMGDLISLDKIIHAKTPAEVKRLGRRVKPWKQLCWDNNV